MAKKKRKLKDSEVLLRVFKKKSPSIYLKKGSDIQYVEYQDLIITLDDPMVAKLCRGFLANLEKLGIELHANSNFQDPKNDKK